MKFQNSSIYGFKVMLCIKKRDEWTEGRTNNPETICPSNFFEVGGIIIHTPNNIQDIRQNYWTTEKKLLDFVCRGGWGGGGYKKKNLENRV